MTLKRGDIVRLKENSKGDFFLIDRVGYKANKVEAYRVKVKTEPEQKKPNRWYYEYNNGIKTLFIRFDMISSLKEDSVELSDLTLQEYENVLLNLTDLRKANKEKLQWKEHLKKKSNIIRQKKKNKKNYGNMTSEERKLAKSAELSREKNQKKPTNLYNEKITIVRG